MDLQTLKHRFVEVFHKGKLVPAYVKDVKEKRLRVVLPSGKEELISHSGLVFFESHPVKTKDISSILEVLKEKHEKREVLKDNLSIRDVWEVVVDELEEADARELCELLLGREVDEDEVAGFMRKCLEERLFFKFKAPNTLEVASREEVQRKIQQKQKELERLKKLSEGERFLEALEKGKLDEFSEEVKDFWLTAFKNYVLWQEEAPQGKLVSEVLKRRSLTDPLKLFFLLVKAGVFDEDANLELLKLRFPVEFSKSALEEAKKLSSLIPSEYSRKDLTDLNTFTIDAEDTQDFDDAISVEKLENGWRLWIHIAEVAEFISPKMHLWKEALERASTLYLPDAIIPMLPFSLSHEKFSLKENEIKPAVTFEVRLSEELEVLDFKPVLSTIQVKKRLTYDEVDELITTDEFWSSLWQLFSGLRKKREQNGAIAVFLPEVLVKVKEDGSIEVSKLEMTPARLLVAEAMILTNTLAAKFLHENQVPALFRSQPKPIEVIEDREKDFFHKILQLRYLSKSELGLTPDYHSGLGVNYYTTISSPIRRFLDLLMQYQLKCFLTDKPPLSEEDLKKTLPELEENLQRAAIIQSKRHKYFLLKYLKLYKKDEVLRGIVINTQARRAKVYLPDYNITGELMSSKVSPGEEVNVKIDRVNPHQELLRLKTV